MDGRHFLSLWEGLDCPPIYGKKDNYPFQPKTDKKSSTKKEKGEIFSMVHFFIPMKIPTATHQEKQVRVIHGKPCFYEPTNVKDARQKYLAYLGKYVPEQKLEGAISLTVKFVFCDEKMASSYRWKTTKPDTDNMIKLVKDCMTKLGYWHDDAQVCRELVEKFYSRDVEGIYIELEALKTEKE